MCKPLQPVALPDSPCCCPPSCCLNSSCLNSSSCSLPAAFCALPVAAPLQPWLFLGVCLILGFGDRWYIAVIASGVFLGLVIIIPLVWECFLPEATKRRINLAVGSFQVKRDRSGTELLRPRSEAE